MEGDTSITAGDSSVSRTSCYILKLSVELVIMILDHADILSRIFTKQTCRPLREIVEDSYPQLRLPIENVLALHPTVGLKTQYCLIWSNQMPDHWVCGHCSRIHRFESDGTAPALQLFNLCPRSQDPVQKKITEVVDLYDASHNTAILRCLQRWDSLGLAMQRQVKMYLSSAMSVSHSTFKVDWRSHKVTDTRRVFPKVIMDTKYSSSLSSATETPRYKFVVMVERRVESIKCPVNVSDLKAIKPCRHVNTSPPPEGRRSVSKAARISLDSPLKPTPSQGAHYTLEDMAHEAFVRFGQGEMRASCVECATDMAIEFSYSPNNTTYTVTVRSWHVFGTLTSPAPIEAKPGSIRELYENTDAATDKMEMSDEAIIIPTGFLEI